MHRALPCAAAGLLSLAVGTPSTLAGTLTFEGAGPGPADIQGAVDDYRAALGVDNGGAPGSFGSGRREISWDGVPDEFSSPNGYPVDFFNAPVAGRARGAVFQTQPGTSLRVSADADNPTGTPVRFGEINPTYPEIFQTFSAERLFSPVGTNLVDLLFFVPGTDTPAVTRGFGAVYADADDAGDTTFEYFDVNNNSLGVFNIPSADNGLSFLGVLFDEAVVHRVRIAYGNTALGPDDGGDVDVAVMDDFIYGEPVAAGGGNPIPLPPAALMAGAGAAPLVLARALRRRLRKS